VVSYNCILQPLLSCDPSYTIRSSPTTSLQISTNHDLP